MLANRFDFHLPSAGARYRQDELRSGDLMLLRMRPEGAEYNNAMAQGADAQHPTNTYLYGLSRIGELQPGGFLYHLTDALGSVRQLVNASGAVKLTCQT